MMKVDCLLCGASANKVHSNYTGYQLPQTFKIYSCPTCNTNFSEPRVNASSMYDVIYSQGESHPGYERYWKYARAAKLSSNPLKFLENSEPTYFGVAEFLREYNILSTAKILEVGSGLGYLTYSLRKAGYSATAIELSKVAVDDAIKNYGDFYIKADLFEYSKEHKSSYDIVIATELIEHVENPVEFISAMLDLVKPNGYVVLTSPNKSFFPNEMVWESSLPPIHCWWFSENSMKYIANLLKVSIFFINFKNFFSNKEKLSWSIDQCVNTDLPVAILDENNNVVNVSTDNKNSSNKLRLAHCLKSLVKRVPGIAMLVQYFKRANNVIFVGEKCHYMCVVLKKTTND